MILSVSCWPCVRRIRKVWCGTGPSSRLRGNGLRIMRFMRWGGGRTKTADVDLDWPQGWMYRIGYGLVGAVVWPFIK